MRLKTIKEFLHGLPSIYISLGLLVILTLILYVGNPSFLSVYNLKTIASATAILLAVGQGQTMSSPPMGWQLPASRCKHPTNCTRTPRLRVVVALTLIIQALFLRIAVAVMHILQLLRFQAQAHDCMRHLMDENVFMRVPPASNMSVQQQ